MLSLAWIACFFLPRGLCTCCSFFLEGSSAHSKRLARSSFRSQLKCHCFRKDFLTSLTSKSPCAATFSVTYSLSCYLVLPAPCPSSSSASSSFFFIVLYQNYPDQCLFVGCFLPWNACSMRAEDLHFLQCWEQHLAHQGRPIFLKYWTRFYKNISLHIFKPFYLYKWRRKETLKIIVLECTRVRFLTTATPSYQDIIMLPTSANSSEYIHGCHHQKGILVGVKEIGRLTKGYRLEVPWGQTPSFQWFFQIL